MPSSDQLTVIRSWVGSTAGKADDPHGHDNDDLNERLGRLGTAEAVALEILRERRADMLTNPVQFAADGDWSQNSAENIRALDQQIGQLERATGQATVSVGAMTRGRAR